MGRIISYIREPLNSNKQAKCLIVRACSSLRAFTAVIESKMRAKPFKKIKNSLMIKRVFVFSFQQRFFNKL